MISYALDQLHLFKILSPNFEIAIEYVLNTDFSKLEDGKYEIAGEDVFATVKAYETKPASGCHLESHRMYADIQILVAGSEQFGVTQLTNQQPTTPFLPNNDVCFYTLPASDLNYITLNAGQFIIFLPSDIHQPDMAVTMPGMVRKVVIKVKL